MNSPVGAAQSSQVAVVAQKTLPLLLRLDVFQILPSEIPSYTFLAKCMGTIVAEIYLTALITPPAELVISIRVFLPRPLAVLLGALIAHNDTYKAKF